MPPRRPKRRPHLGTSAIQRPSRGRYLLLLMFQGLASGQSSTKPIFRCRANESADAVRHTTALTVAVGSSYESPVTEAFYLHRPARLFRGPRNWNTSRYGTLPLTATTGGRAPQAFWFVLNDLKPPEPKLITNCILR